MQFIFMATDYDNSTSYRPIVDIRFGDNQMSLFFISSNSNTSIFFTAVNEPMLYLNRISIKHSPFLLFGIVNPFMRGGFRDRFRLRTPLKNIL